MTDTAVLERAIIAATSGSGESQREANQWLHAFGQSPEVWAGSLAMIESPNPGVQFFAMNMLCSKIRTSWMLLDAGTRASLYQRLLGLVQSVLEGRTPFNRPTTIRLCGTVATAAALAGGEACDVFLQQCVGMGMAAGGGAAAVALSVDLIEAFAQETLLRPYARPETVVPIIQRHLTSILSLLQSITLTAGPAGDLSLSPGASTGFKCAMGFIRGGGSLRYVTAQCPNLLRAALMAVVQPKPSTVLLTAAVELLVEWMADAGSLPAAAVADPDQFGGLSMVMDGAVASWPVLEQAVKEDDGDVAHLLSRVLVGLVDSCANILLLGDPRSERILSALLFVNQHGELGCRELVAEVWPKLIAVPKSQRMGVFTDASFFQKCVGVLVHSAAYPPGFVSWAKNSLDFGQTEFMRYRGQLCGEALSAVAGDIGVSSYLQFLGSLLQQALGSSAGWTAVEMVLFGTRVVNLEVKSFLRGKDPGGQADRSLVQEFLTALFSTISSASDVMTSCSFVVEACCRCVAEFGIWVAQQAPLLPGIVAYLLRALPIGDVGVFAASALRNLMAHRGAFFDSEEVLNAVIAQLDAATAAGLELEARKTLAQAIARILTNSALQDALVGKLFSPVLGRLGGLLSVGMGTAKAEEELASKFGDEIAVLASIIQFLESAASLPRVLAAFDHIWLMLQSALDRFKPFPSVAVAVFELIEFGVRASGKAGRIDFATTALVTCTGVVASSPSPPPAAIACVSSVVEMLGGQPSAHPTLLAALDSVCTSGFEASKHKVEGRSDLVASLFELAHQFMVFCPSVLVPSPTFDALVAAGDSLCIGEDNTVCRAVARFLSVAILAGASSDLSVAGWAAWTGVMAAPGERGALRPFVDAVVQRRGAPLVQTILRSLTETAQPDSIDPLSEVLLACIRAYPGVALPTVAAALTDPGFVGNKNGTLPPEAREGVVHTLTFASTCPALGLDAFRDMVGDLVRVVRAQAPLDALAAALRTVQGV